MFLNPANLRPPRRHRLNCALGLAGLLLGVQALAQTAAPAVPAAARAAIPAAAAAAPARPAPAPRAAPPAATVVPLALTVTAAPAAPAPAPAAAPAPAPLACMEVEEALLQLSTGRTTRYAPKHPVLRLVLDEGANRSGVAGGTSPDDASPTAAAGGLQTRGNSQAVAPRPGAGEVAVRLLGPSDLYFTGRSIGSTNVVLVHGSGRCTMLSLLVAMDPVALQAAIDTLLPEEKLLVPVADRVKVTAAFDSLVLRGTVSDSEALVRVTDLANAYLRGSGEGAGNSSATASNPRLVNMLSVAAPQQVMLEVKVAEISKNLLDQFGINFSRAYAANDGSMIRFLSGIFGGTTGEVGQIGGTGPNGVPFSSVSAVVGGVLPSTLPGAPVGGNVVRTPTGYQTQFGTVPGRNVSNGTLNMQKNDGLVKVLAEPTVMAISGQTGSFLAGGKIFIPVAQSNDNGGRTVTLEEKEFGVSVRFTPTVLGNGLINLKVRPEVSELSQSGVTISGIGGTAVLPAFTSRKAETTVQLMDGQSFAIGGLIKNNTTTNIKAFPFLGEVPVLGALFRSTEFQTDRAELVFVITPRLVKPLPPDYKLPTEGYVPPTRNDLILHGRTEGSRSDAPADKPLARPAAAPSVQPLPGAGGFDTQAPEKR